MPMHFWFTKKSIDMPLTQKKPMTYFCPWKMHWHKLQHVSCSTWVPSARNASARATKYIKHLKEWVWWTSINFKSPLIMSCIGSNTNTVVQTTGRWSSLRTDAFLPCLTAQRMYSRQRMEGFALKNPSCPAPSGCLISGCMKSKLVMDAWSPKSIRRGAVAANHH